MKLSGIKNLAKFVQSTIPSFKLQLNKTPSNFFFTPSPHLHHPLLQSIYNCVQPKMIQNYKRQHLYMQDGGNVALDWGLNQNNQKVQPSLKPPILFIMHGLTGGSDTNYIKALVKQGKNQGYQPVTLNSRGINTPMTSPLPFTGTSFTQLQSALKRIQEQYPQSQIYMIGTSFGGNYLIRYLIQNQRPTIKGLVALSPPFDCMKVIDDMGIIYQRFFVKRYIHETVLKHPQMRHWQQIGLLNLKQVQQSKNLRQYHTNLTAKIVGVQTADDIFKKISITQQMTKKLKVNTLIMTSKDDPIVSYNALPLKQIQQNQKIKFVTTQTGGHLCWFQGIKPKRWYPKPTIDYLSSLRNQK